MTLRYTTRTVFIRPCAPTRQSPTHKRQRVGRGTLRAYVINLARSPERRKDMITQLTENRTDFDIVQAVDGRQLDMTDEQTIASIAPSFLDADWFLPTHAACALSHLSVYRKILADGLDCALVLEDDVLLPTDIGDLVDAVSGSLAGAEVALLNFDSPHAITVSHDDARDLPGSRQLVWPLDPETPASAAAYVITREACERMVAHGLPIRAKADNWAHFRREGIIDRIRCVVPLPIMKNPNFSSTIGYYSDTSAKGRLVGLITRHNLRFLQRVIAFRRKRILRRYTRVSFVSSESQGDPPEKSAKSKV